MYCPHCGSQVGAANQDCPVCHKDMLLQEPQIEKKSTPLWLTITVFGLIAAILYTGTLYLLTEEVESPVEGQLNAIRENRITESYYEYTSKEFQENTSFDAFKAFLKAHPQLAEITAITIHETESNSDAATIEGVLSFADGSETPVQYTLVKEEGSWKILGIDFASDEHEGKPSQELHQQYNKPQISVETKQNHAFAEDHSSFKGNDYSYNPARDEFLAQVSEEINARQNTPKATEEIKAPLPKAPEPIKESAPVTPSIIQSVSNPEPMAPAPAATPAMAPTVAPKAATPPSGHSQEEFTSADFFDLIQLQMRALRQNDTTRAYSSEFTSKGFRDATTLKQFEDYMRKHSIFAQNKGLEFNKLTLKDGVTTVTTTLMVNDIEKYTVEYTFVKDDGKWKIQHILIPTPESGTILQGKAGESNTVTGPLEYSKAVFGNVVDAQGMIKDPELVLKSTNSNVFINLYIKNGVTGTKLDLQLQHVESGAKTSDVSTTLQKDGDMVLSIGYPAPKTGWLKGTYKLTVKSSSGAQNTFLFIIE